MSSGALSGSRILSPDRKIPPSVFASCLNSPLVPKSSEIENLITPTAVSASHIAYGSIRMEPVFMILGQSAGTAAAMAIDGEKSVQEVPYDKLRKRLIADEQKLD